jgi:hypothetical protein
LSEDCIPFWPLLQPVNIRITIRHVISLFSNDSSGSNVSCLELFLDIVSRVVEIPWNTIVLGVLAAFVRGMTHPLLEVMFTFNMIGSAINNLGDKLSFLGKDLLPGPLLLSLKLGLAGNLLEIRRVGLSISLPLLLWRRGSRKTKLMDLCSQGKDLLLFPGGVLPLPVRTQVLYLFSLRQ